MLALTCGTYPCTVSINTAISPTHAFVTTVVDRVIYGDGRCDGMKRSKSRDLTSATTSTLHGACGSLLSCMVSYRCSLRR